MVTVPLALLWFQNPPPQNPMPPINDPSALTLQFQQMIPQWFGAVQPFATRTFYALMALELTYLGIEVFQRKRHSDGIDGITFSLTEKLLACGFWLAFVNLAGGWIPAIINSFIAVGKAGTNMPNLGPSIILGQGFKIAGTLFAAAWNVGWMNLLSATSIGLMIAAVGIIIAFLILTALLVMTLVHSYLAIGTGLIFLAFGGSQWTRSYAEKYVSYCVSVGIKLMMIYFLVGAGWQLSNNWIQMAQNVPQDQAGVLTGWLIACGAFLYLTIVWSGASFISSIMSGASLSHRDALGMVVTGVSSAVSAGMIAGGMVGGGAAGGAGAAGASGAAKASGGGATTTVAASSAPSPSPRVPASSPNGSRN